MTQRQRPLLPIFSLLASFFATSGVATANLVTEADGKAALDTSLQQGAATMPSAQDKVDPPRRVTYVPPQYTPEATRAKIQGDVVVNARITPTGTLEDLRIERSLDKIYGLDEKALEAVRQWRYEPARRNGQPFAVRVNVTVKFELDSTALAPSWPSTFVESASSASTGAGWTFATVPVGGAALQYGTPEGWTADTTPPAPRVLRLSGNGGHSIVEVGPPTPFAVDTATASALSLPVSSEATLRQLANTIATRGGRAAAPAFNSVGQVQIGARWWVWFDLDTPAPSLNEMRPEFRDALAKENISGAHGWLFSTIDGQQVYQVLCIALLPGSAANRDAEMKRAGASFAAVLRRMTLSTR